MSSMRIDWQKKMEARTRTSEGPAGTSIATFAPESIATDCESVTHLNQLTFFTAIDPESESNVPS